MGGRKEEWEDVNWGGSRDRTDLAMIDYFVLSYYDVDVMCICT